jgi:hypothetical protein
MLLSKLSRESELKTEEIKKICSCATFNRIPGRGEMMFCLGAKGITAPKEACVIIGNVWPGEVCKATEFHPTDHSGYYYSVNTEKMKECQYRRVENERIK